jgi:RNA polymerase sigma factor (sigma-70 family)
MLAADELLLEREYLASGDALVHRLIGTTRDRDAATDIAHEAYLRLTREVVAGRTPANPGAWVYRVGLNLAFSRSRHLGVVGRLTPSIEPVPQEDVPEQMVLQAERARALRRTLAQLPPVERHAMVLSAEGYQPSEIAPLIGRSPAATRTMLCRARAKLRAKLADA